MRPRRPVRVAREHEARQLSFEAQLCCVVLCCVVLCCVRVCMFVCIVLCCVRVCVVCVPVWQLRRRQAVASYIHSLGLNSGIYTARGPVTCARLAASCGHEVQDAANWAAWGVDFVKDDACSVCPNRSDDDDYHAMWAAIQASGRPMVLTVEGNPDDALITLGGYGNAKRVGKRSRRCGRGRRWCVVPALVLVLQAESAVDEDVDDDDDDDDDGDGGHGDGGWVVSLLVVLSLLVSALTRWSVVALSAA